MQQYREHDVPQNPALWHNNIPENCKYGDKFTSRISQVAFNKSLEQQKEPAEVTVHFLKDFDWHDTTVVRIKIRVSDGKCGHKKWQVDLSKATVEKQPTFVQKLPSLPSARKTRTESSATWKVYPQTADQGSITVFIAKGNWNKECNNFNSVRRPWVTSESEPTKFCKRSGKHGVYLCFEFQVRRKSHAFAPASRQRHGELVNLGEGLPQFGDVVKATPQTPPAGSSIDHSRTSVASSLLSGATLDYERIGASRPSTIDAGSAHMNQMSRERRAHSSNAIAQVPIHHPDNHMSHVLEMRATGPDTGTRKRTASVAGLDSIAPGPLCIDPTNKTTLGMQKPLTIHRVASPAARPRAASIEPMRERRSRAESACVTPGLPISTNLAVGGTAAPCARQHSLPATCVDLTGDEDASMKREPSFFSSAIAGDEKQGMDEEDEEDLQLELRAIRTEQKLRALRKQKQRDRQAGVKTEFS
ncbi:hypothetical protein Slin15195_G034720 [Septoria linicola]|uniref:Uncharacterized protein n=1 Tax=Septoria linicola TaxID=215465 RepID=A0A9Q9ANE0_9PEZI|nr:hypothetical protein Slin15195_G034720 [Septoria linicola]